MLVAHPSLCVSAIHQSKYLEPLCKQGCIATKLACIISVGQTVLHVCRQVKESVALCQEAVPKIQHFAVSALRHTQTRQWFGVMKKRFQKVSQTPDCGPQKPVLFDQDSNKVSPVQELDAKNRQCVAKPYCLVQPAAHVVSQCMQ